MMKGYVTVFFTIVISLCMSLILVSFTGVKDVASRARIEESASISINSLYGEYQKELWGIYDLIFVDAGYSYKANSMILPEEHLKETMNKNFDESGIEIIGNNLLNLKCEEVETLGVRFASDDYGAAIINQACSYMRYKYKVSYIESLYRIISDYEKEEMEYSEYLEIYDNSLSSFESIDDTGSYELKVIKDVSNEAILTEKEPTLLLTIKAVFNSPYELSKENINEKSLISQRDINKGNIKSLIDEKYINKLLFREYLVKHTDSYIEKKNEAGLAYEAEYLIAGKSSDLENLESVLNRILLIRESCNLITLTNDVSKMNEIDTVSKIIATIAGVPEASDAIKATIVILWSYLESIHDLKELVAGKGVPFIKNEKEWKTSFLNMGKTEVADSSNSLKYEDYLRLFLYMTSTKTLTNRFMNIVEHNIRIVSGNAFFRLDYCFDAYKYNAICMGNNGKSYSITRVKDIER